MTDSGHSYKLYTSTPAITNVTHPRVQYRLY